MTTDHQLAAIGDSHKSRGQAMVEFALVAPFLFVMLIAIIEAGIFVLNMETLNNATREGARYAIVHGSMSSCPSGPMPGGRSNPCDQDGDNIREAVLDSAVGLTSVGDLRVAKPIWTVGGSTQLPSGPGDTSAPSGTNARGEHVSVYAEYSYKPIIKLVLDPISERFAGTELIPSITLRAESTLVINN